MTERPIVPTSPAPRREAPLPPGGQPSAPRYTLQIEALEARIAPGGAASTGDVAQLR